MKPVDDLQKAAAGAFAAFTIASSTFQAPPADAFSPAVFSSSNVVSEKVTREGIYGEYEVDLPPQVYDDARSTFKSAKETKTKKGTCFPMEADDRALVRWLVSPVVFNTSKCGIHLTPRSGKYTALLAVLIVGSFVIPMAQYWWYVKDDDSSDKFFAQDIPEPKEPPKRKWF